jgi:hypothetical protein
MPASDNEAESHGVLAKARARNFCGDIRSRVREVGIDQHHDGSMVIWTNGVVRDKPRRRGTNASIDATTIYFPPSDTAFGGGVAWAKSYSVV